MAAETSYLKDEDEKDFDALFREKMRRAQTDDYAARSVDPELSLSERNRAKLMLMLPKTSKVEAAKAKRLAEESARQNASKALKTEIATRAAGKGAQKFAQKGGIAGVRHALATAAPMVRGVTKEAVELGGRAVQEFPRSLGARSAGFLGELAGVPLAVGIEMYNALDQLGYALSPLSSARFIADKGTGPYRTIADIPESLRKELSQEDLSELRKDGYLLDGAEDPPERRTIAARKGSKAPNPYRGG